MNEANACPICGEGHLHPEYTTQSIEYKGQTGSVPVCYSVCDVCEVEQAGASELRANKRAVLAFKKQIDGLLTGAEVKALREQLGLNQTQAAQVFGGGPVAFSKYENDDVMQSEAMDKLLRVAREVPLAKDYLFKQAGIESPDYTKVDQPAVSGVKAKRPHLKVVATYREFQPQSQTGYSRAVA